MELNFEKRAISYLDPVLQEIQNREQTQEIKLPEAMPDIGKILTAWCQPILRSKEWRSDRIMFSGGMMVWVLYLPEDGSRERCIDGWIPFQMHWDLPEDVPEGQIRFRCLPRFVDARNVSPRKIMIRAGLGVLAEAFVPVQKEIYAAENPAADLQLLKSAYPLRLAAEAGEKRFLIEDELILPESAPMPEKLVYYRLNPVLTDKKILSNKAVFRGNGNLHTLYRSEEGQLYSWDFELPFSQFSDLEQEHSSDAQGDIALMPTNLEMDLDGEGHMKVKCAMTAQYVIHDQRMMELVEDAYAPGRQVDIHAEELELPVILDNRRENLYGEQTISADANVAADVTFLPDFPQQRRMGEQLIMEQPGTFQILYYGEDGILHSGTARWEENRTIPADENSEITALPQPMEATANVGQGQIRVKTELPVDMMTTTRQRLPMVSGVELGEQQEADPGRPTLILRKAGNIRLWDIAKNSGTTVEQIQRANGLSGDPAPDQMLLIPVS